MTAQLQTTFVARAGNMMYQSCMQVNDVLAAVWLETRRG